MRAGFAGSFASRRVGFAPAAQYLTNLQLQHVSFARDLAVWAPVLMQGLCFTRTSSSCHACLATGGTLRRVVVISNSRITPRTLRSKQTKIDKEALMKKLKALRRQTRPPSERLRNVFRFMRTGRPVTAQERQPAVKTVHSRRKSGRSSRERGAQKKPTPPLSSPVCFSRGTLCTPQRPFLHPARKCSALETKSRPLHVCIVCPGWERVVGRVGHQRDYKKHHVQLVHRSQGETSCATGVAAVAWPGKHMAWKGSMA